MATQIGIMTHKRPSLVSRSSALGEDWFQRVRSLPSTCLSASPSPQGTPYCVANPQKTVAQLTAVAQGKDAAGLELFDVLRQAMLHSPIFRLFEHHEVMKDAMVERLRRMHPSGLIEITRKHYELTTWRQDGLGPAKVSHLKTPLEMVGLVAAAYTLLGQERGAAACQAARLHISPGQQLEKRFTVLLLTVSAALGSPLDPIDIEPLRKHCKEVIDRMHECSPKKRGPRRDQLLKRMGRFITQRQGEKLQATPEQLPSAVADKNAIVGLPGEDSFVHLGALDASADASDEGCMIVDVDATPSEPFDKFAYTRGWLAKIWR